MNDKIFSLYELYDLVNAEDSALTMEVETGIKSGWFEFAEEDEYRDKIEQLECGEEQFEADLKDTASVLREKFETLLFVSEDAYDSVDEYDSERDLIMNDILSVIRKKMQRYCKE